MLEIFALICLIFKQRGQTLRAFCKNGANGITNSEDPDQTAPSTMIRLLLTFGLKNIAVKMPNLRVFRHKDANGIENSKQ